MKQIFRFSLPHFSRLFRFGFFFSLVFLFTGCNVPFTDTVVTLPWLEKKPDVALSAMTEKMLSLDTAHSDIDLQAQVDSSTASLASDMHVTLSGDFDASDPEEVKSTTALAYETSLSGFQVGVKADSVTIGDNVYLRFTELPSLGLLGLPNLTEQWFIVTPETLANSSLLSFTDVLPFDLTTSPASLYGNVTPEQKQQLNSIAQKTAFFRFEQRLPDEKIEDVKTYHYLVSVDQAAVQDFVAEAAIILQDTLAAQETSSSDTLLDTLQNLKINSLELWIGKKDFYLRKAVADVTFQSDAVNNTATAGAVESLPETSTHINAEFLFSHFGQRVNIVAPSDAQTFEEFLKQRFSILGGLGG